MEHQQLINFLVFSRLKNAVAAGTTTQTSTGLSCGVGSSFLFGILMGTITATGTPVCSIQVSTDGGSNYSDLEGSGITLVASTDDNKLILLELDLPKVSWTHVRVQVTRPTANAVIDGIFSCHYGAKNLQPRTQGTGVHASSKYLVTPAVGTA